MTLGSFHSLLLRAAKGIRNDAGSKLRRADAASTLGAPSSFTVAQTVPKKKILPAIQEIRVPSLGRKRKAPWRRKRQPTPVFLPGDRQGVADCSPWALRVGTRLSDERFHLSPFLSARKLPFGEEHELSCAILEREGPDENM